MKKRTKKSTNKLGTATTLRACMVKTGLPLNAIKSAQAGACVAFKANGRIDCDELIEFIANHPPTDTDAPDYFTERALSMRADRKLKEQKLKEREKLVVPVADVTRVWRTITISAKMKMNSATAELASLLAMRLALSNEQTAIVRELHSKLMRRVQSELHQQKFGPITCPHCEKEIEK
jgi:hypothetical protein